MIVDCRVFVRSCGLRVWALALFWRVRMFVSWFDGLLVCLFLMYVWLFVFVLRVVLGVRFGLYLRDWWCVLIGLYLFAFVFCLFVIVCVCWFVWSFVCPVVVGSFVRTCVYTFVWLFVWCVVECFCLFCVGCSFVVCSCVWCVRSCVYLCCCCSCLLFRLCSLFICSCDRVFVCSFVWLVVGVLFCLVFVFGRVCACPFLCGGEFRCLCVCFSCLFAHIRFYQFCFSVCGLGPFNFVFMMRAHILLCFGHTF